MINSVINNFSDHTQLVHNILSNPEKLHAIRDISYEIYDCYKRGNKILIAGNGGSAADAQHMAGELIGQFMYLDRPSVPTIALSTDTSVITSIANDRGFDAIYSRQVEGLGNPGDIYIVISTSGNSTNLVESAKVAKGKGMIVYGLLGKDGGILRDLCNYAFIVESDSTPRIQEIHLLVYHTICEIVEKLVKYDE
jgi:D-sedoheptulose 7-phosphate isomerase